MGTIRKKKTSALTRMSGFRSIADPATLYPEDRAKFLAAQAQAGDPDWKWEAVLVNPERGLWAVQYTDEQGHAERASF